MKTYSRPNSISTGSALTNLSCITCSSDNSIRFWSLNSHPTSSNIFSRQLMKIIYLDEDFSKLCDSQTIQGNQICLSIDEKKNETEFFVFNLRTTGIRSKSWWSMYENES